MATPLHCDCGLFLSTGTLYTLYVNGVEVCVVDDFLEALTLHYAMFFVMDIEYPQQITNYLSFVQTVLMGQQDANTKRRKVLYLLKKMSEVNEESLS